MEQVCGTWQTVKSKRRQGARSLFFALSPVVSKRRRSTTTSTIGQVTKLVLMLLLLDSPIKDRRLYLPAAFVRLAEKWSWRRRWCQCSTTAYRGRQAGIHTHTRSASPLIERCSAQLQLQTTNGKMNEPTNERQYLSFPFSVSHCLRPSDNGN